MPGLSLEEQRGLNVIEAGELPAKRWPRLARVDPEPGKFPPVAKVRPERVLHYHLWTEEDPQNGLAGAMQTLGHRGHARMDWPTMPATQRAQTFEQLAAELQPTVIFLQLQSPDALDLHAIARVRQAPHDPALVVVAWSGDVGPVNGPWPGLSDAWSYELANYIDVMLFTGTGQVKMHRERGMPNAAYLQIGFDEDRYFPGDLNSYGTMHDIVFLGQNYGEYFEKIPGNEVGLRRAVVDAFRRFPRFAAYGSGWGGSTAHQTEVGGIYRNSLMSISVSLTSGLDRYTSDRLIRSMACGTPTLVKRFVDMEGLGLEDGVNCITWDSVGEAVEKAQYWLEPQRREELLAIGQTGSNLMKSRHTWTYRLSEFAAILRAARGYP
jgi:CheY-like chemotaxis protein